MDDLTLTSLNETKNETILLALNILTPRILEGFRDIFREAETACKNNKVPHTYLKHFQNLIPRIKSWNAITVDNEVKNIIKKSGITYLPDLIICIHMIYMKIISNIRAGSRQKIIKLKCPDINAFIHNVYINAGRAIYVSVDLFETGIKDIQIMRNNREIERIIKESIITTVREFIPVGEILAAYMDETVEENDVVEIKEEVIVMPDVVGFKETDTARDENGNEVEISAPKDIPHLESIYRGQMDHPDVQDDDISQRNQPKPALIFNDMPESTTIPFINTDTSTENFAPIDDIIEPLPLTPIMSPMQTDDASQFIPLEMEDIEI